MKPREQSNEDLSPREKKTEPVEQTYEHVVK